VCLRYFHSDSLAQLMAESASKAIGFSQCLRLKCGLYFNPLFNSWVSFSVNSMFEGLSILRSNRWLLSLFCCIRLDHNFFSSWNFFFCMCGFEFTLCSMLSYGLFHVLALYKYILYNSVFIHSFFLYNSLISCFTAIVFASRAALSLEYVLLLSFAHVGVRF
jgi:hypothetical protein